MLTTTRFLRSVRSEECSAAGGGGLLGDRDYDGKRRGDRRGNRLRRDIERERERELEDAAGHFSSRFQSLEEVLGQVRPCYKVFKV